MIKFFRRIRQRLLSDHKFTKYLVYAIGEIILVVIGILIALSINNWNETRKEKVLERQLVNLLITDLKEKQEENNKDLVTSEKMIKRFLSTIEIWETQKMIDTTHLKQNLRTLGGDNYFQNESSPIYSGLSTSNFWKQLPDSLNNQIDDVYRIRLKRIEKAFEKASEYGTHCKLNFLTPNDIDLNQDTEAIMKKVALVRKEYISYSKLFINTSNYVKWRLEGSLNEINSLVENLNYYNETNNK